MTPDRARGDIVLGENPVASIVLGVIMLILLAYAIRWAYAEYWITMHCTTILGTRVCQ